MSSANRKPWLFALLAVLIVLVTEQVIEHYALRSAVSAEQSSVQERLSTIRARLEGVINANLLLVHGLTAVISAQPDLDQHAFANIARGLVDDRHALRNIAGAPGMVIRLMYPLTGNKAAIGLDYLKHPTQGAAARKVQASGQAVLAGPLPLQQGGIGIILREPVYVPAQAAGEAPRFWGLVSAVIDVDQLYRLAGLDVLDTSLQLAIRGVDGSGEKGAVFFGKPAVFDQVHVRQAVSLPGGHWQLAALPAAGWGQHKQALLQIRLLGLLVALIAGAMAWRLARSGQTLRETALRLQESEQLFTSFMQHLPAGAYIRDLASERMLFQNRWLCESLVGQAQGEARGVVAGAAMSPISLAMLAGDRSMAGEDHMRSQEAVTDRNGAQLYCDVQRFSIPRNLLEEEGKTGERMGAIIVDVTARVQAEQRVNRLNRVYAVLSGINETIVRQKDRASLFQEACRIAVDVGGFRMAWLGMLDLTSGEVRPLAHAGVVDGYLENLRITLGDDERLCGPTGSALMLGQHAVCNDIASDPVMAPWREAALALGYRASAALPIKVAGQVRGAFNLYSGQAGFFDAEELRLLDELALDIGFALEYLDAEEQVRRGETVLQSVFQVLPDLFFLMDADGVIRDYHARRGGDLYLPPEAFLGKRMQDVLPSDLAEQFSENIALASAQDDLVTYEYDLAMPQGLSRFEARLSRLPDSTQLIAVVRDISIPHQNRQDLAASELALRQSEEQLRQLNASLEARVVKRTAELDELNQSLESFVYSVSHDLKTPLRGVEGYSRLLETDYADSLDDEGRLFIGHIRTGVMRMAELIDDLLAYSRIERRRLDAAVLQLPELVQQLLAEQGNQVAQVSNAPGVEIVVDLPDLAVRGDVDGLGMVLRNLLENARKFSAYAEHPRIEIGARRQGDKVRLWVRDNGIGFDMKYHDRIFEIFQRLHRLETYPGTGIGLAMVRKATQRMGGRVWAESALGAGATFYVELPAADVERAMA